MLITKHYDPVKKTKIKSKEYKTNDVYDSINDEPSLTMYGRDDSIILKQWHKNGILHRENKPCVQKFINNELQYEEYRVNGKLHRDVLPAQIFVNIKEKWYQNGELLSDILYDDNKNIVEKRWYQNRKLHRDNEPALISYYSDENIKEEKWYKKGNLFHTSDNPSVKKYYKNGNIKEKEWVYSNGKYRKSISSLEYHENGKIKEKIWRRGSVEQYNCKYDEQGNVLLIVEPPLEAPPVVPAIQNLDNIVQNAIDIIRRSHSHLIDKDKLLIIEKTSIDEECVICWNKSDNLFKTRCKHLICKPCLQQCIRVNTKCPYCRQELSE